VVGQDLSRLTSLLLLSLRPTPRFEPIMAKPIEAVVLDIEGTTTSISFVAEVLFPYARRELKNHLQANWGTPSINEIVEGLSQLAKADGTPMAPEGTDINNLVEHYHAQLVALMDADRKVTPLKFVSFITNILASVLFIPPSFLPLLRALQGDIWSKGYVNGELVGHLYDDVVPAFNRWKSLGIPIYIYSSGSIAAQKLLFGHTAAGSLLPFISGHFDTTTGPKIEAPSYTKIAETLNKDPSTILFSTDALLEAEAARQASIGHVFLAIRPGNKPFEGPAAEAASKFPQIQSFDLLSAPEVAYKTQ
jgi:enolase-phosphatase E1